MSKPVIAVLGGNGLVGPAILNTLISPAYKNRISFPIRIITRSEEKTKQKSPFIAENAQLFEFYTDTNLVTGENLGKAIEGTSVVINTTTAEFGHKKIADVVAQHLSTVKLYIVSEFGNDTRGSSLGPYEFYSQVKMNNRSYARSLGIKAVSFYTGVFADLLFPNPKFPIPGPGIVFDGNKAFYYTPDAEYSTTSLPDVARCVASFITNALQLPDLSTVPDDILIRGDVVTNKKVAKVYEKVIGKPIELVEIPGSEKVKEASRVEKEGVKGMADFVVLLQVIFSQGYGNIKPTAQWPGKDEIKFESIEDVTKRLYN